MKAIVACEESAVVRDALIECGVDAISCDLKPTANPGPHYQGDIRDILYTEKWGLIIAHPDCTYNCNSGVRWLYERPERWDKLRESIEFFKLFLDHECPKICIENPIPHKHFLWGNAEHNIIGIGRKYDQIIQPWQFGHGETKATCLWLKGLPKLEPTNIVDGREARIHKMAPGKNRQRDRSRTYSGIAKAIAEQWG